MFARTSLADLLDQSVAAKLKEAANTPAAPTKDEPKPEGEPSSES